jgi:hypothetical protein
VITLSGLEAAKRQGKKNQIKKKNYFLAELLPKTFLCCETLQAIFKISIREK